MRMGESIFLSSMMLVKTSWALSLMVTMPLSLKKIPPEGEMVQTINQVAPSGQDIRPPDRPTYLNLRTVWAKVK